MKNYTCKKDMGQEDTEKGKFQSKFGVTQFYKYAHKISKSTPKLLMIGFFWMMR